MYTFTKQEAFENCWAHSPLRAAARPFTRCRCRTPPAHRCPRRQRQQRQRVTEGTAMALWNGPNYTVGASPLDIRIRIPKSNRLSPNSTLLTQTLVERLAKNLYDICRRDSQPVTARCCMVTQSCSVTATVTWSV